ncbi:cag pathogenicity island protein [[Clostridium] scindens]|uniref:cag pathogenicity island protein n=1 Tax=Clostridium scindens (strain JCM 10418 / VPI 12708) TaxID=29347 RepID=UPI00242A9BC1|nr:cag pathogenicity island protein [[Clostridium] scindens]
MAYNEKQKEYTMKYLDKLKEIRFRVKLEEFERYEKAAKKAGYPSMRQFYMDAINEKVEKVLN